MAKKSRRARRQHASRPQSVPASTTAAPASQPIDTPENDQVDAPAPTVAKQVDFVAEYGYIVNDLRSMGIIALAMLALLIVLAFVLQ